MVEPWSLIAERLDGADYDGDMVKVIYEPVICERRRLKKPWTISPIGTICPS